MATSVGKWFCHNFFAIFATFYDSGTKLVEWGRITGLARFLNRVMALTISLISLHIADHRTSALLIKMWTLMMRIDQCWCTTQITSDQMERSSDHILITKLILILSYSSSAITLKDLKRDKVRKKTIPDQPKSNSLSSVGFLGWSESNSGNIASRRFKFSGHTRSHVARHWPVENVIFWENHFFLAGWKPSPDVPHRFSRHASDFSDLARSHFPLEDYGIMVSRQSWWKGQWENCQYRVCRVNQVGGNNQIHHN